MHYSTWFSKPIRWLETFTSMWLSGEQRTPAVTLEAFDVTAYLDGVAGRDAEVAQWSQATLDKLGTVSTAPSSPIAGSGNTGLHSEPAIPCVFDAVQNALHHRRRGLDSSKHCFFASRHDRRRDSTRKLQDPDFQDTATGQLFFPAYMYLYDVVHEAEIERRLKESRRACTDRATLPRCPHPGHF